MSKPLRITMHEPTGRLIMAAQAVRNQIAGVYSNLEIAGITDAPLSSLFNELLFAEIVVYTEIVEGCPWKPPKWNAPAAELRKAAIEFIDLPGKYYDAFYEAREAAMRAMNDDDLLPPESLSEAQKKDPK